MLYSPVSRGNICVPIHNGPAAISIHTAFTPVPTRRPLKLKLDVLTEKNMGAEIERFLGMTFSQFRSQANATGLLLQPVIDIHLHSDLGEEITPER